MKPTMETLRHCVEYNIDEDDGEARIDVECERDFFDVVRQLPEAALDYATWEGGFRDQFTIRIRIQEG